MCDYTTLWNLDAQNYHRRCTDNTKVNQTIYI